MMWQVEGLDYAPEMLVQATSANINLIQTLIRRQRKCVEVGSSQRGAEKVEHGEEWTTSIARHRGFKYPTETWSARRLQATPMNKSIA